MIIYNIVLVIYIIVVAFLWMLSPVYSIYGMLQLDANEILCRSKGDIVHTIVVETNGENKYLSAIRTYAVQLEGHATLLKQVPFEHSCKRLLSCSFGYYNSDNSTLVLTDEKSTLVVYNPIDNSIADVYTADLSGKPFNIEAQYQSSNLYLLICRFVNSETESKICTLINSDKVTSIHHLYTRSCALFSLLGNDNGHIISFRRSGLEKSSLEVLDMNTMTAIALDYRITGLWLGSSIDQVYYEYDPGSTYDKSLGARNVMNDQLSNANELLDSVCSRVCKLNNICFSNTVINNTYISKVIDRINRLIGRMIAIVYTTSSLSRDSCSVSIIIPASSATLIDVNDHGASLLCDNNVYIIYTHNWFRSVLYSLNILNVIGGGLLGVYIYRKRQVQKCSN